MENVCNVCDSTDFTINAGFYYCENCGNRIALLQEIESEPFGGDQLNDTVKLQKHTVKSPKKNERTIELTSYETYNFVIYGLVNELICLGCADELALATLQMWSYYLRQHEVAFFGDNETNVPKMPLKYKSQDLRIINDMPAKKKRKRSLSQATTRSNGSSKNMITRRQRKLRIAKSRRSLATSQYEEYLGSQKSDVSSIGYNLSQPSSTAASSAEEPTEIIQLKFSKLARRRSKKIMSKDHFLLHQSDIAKNLRCHNVGESDNIGRAFVLAIIWLALNHIDDDVQLGDLIRYCEEAHLKLSHVSNFFPPQVDIKQALNNFHRGGQNKLSHLSLRKKAYSIARTIRQRHLKMPDLEKMCGRYCADLCLPPTFADMAKKVIAFYPPRMLLSRNASLQHAAPNYEGRAMAYVLFLMKLIFGLDDDREVRMSRSAQCVNAKMAELNVRHDPIFVWSDWKQYIEMRNGVLSECHYPTAFLSDPEHNITIDLHAEFVKRAIEDNSHTEAFKTKEMQNVNSIFDQTVERHKSAHKHPNNSRHFSPSLTPHSNYLSQILADETLCKNLKIPAYMQVRHNERDMFSYIKPSKLKKAFEEVGHKIAVFQISHNRNVKFAPISIENRYVTEKVRFDFAATKDEWIGQLLKRGEQSREQSSREQQELEEKGKLMSELHIDRLCSKQARIAKEKHSVREGHHGSASDTVSEISSYKYFDEDHNDIAERVVLNEPRRNLDRRPEILDYTSSDESADSGDDEAPLSSLLGDTASQLLVSNFNYWISTENIYFLSKSRKSFEQKVKKLPENFQWLLQECATRTHMDSIDLYIELLAIENKFRYTLKPTFKMSNCYRFRSTAKLKRKIRTVVRQLERIW